MDARVFGLEYNELLEVHEGKASVTYEIGTLASVEVRIKQILVEIDGNTEIGDGFLEHTETGVASSSSQIVQSICLISLFYNSFKIANGVIKSMQCKIKNTSQIQY